MRHALAVTTPARTIRRAMTWARMARRARTPPRAASKAMRDVPVSRLASGSVWTTVPRALSIPNAVLPSARRDTACRTGRAWRRARHAHRAARAAAVVANQNRSRPMADWAEVWPASCASTFVLPTVLHAEMRSTAARWAVTQGCAALRSAVGCRTPARTTTQHANRTTQGVCVLGRAASAARRARILAAVAFATLLSDVASLVRVPPACPLDRSARSARTAAVAHVRQPARARAYARRRAWPMAAAAAWVPIAAVAIATVPPVRAVARRRHAT
jgi:hypothetical protein